jgi:hypothetical protein
MVKKAHKDFSGNRVMLQSIFIHNKHVQYYTLNFI